MSCWKFTSYLIEKFSLFYELSAVPLSFIKKNPIHSSKMKLPLWKTTSLIQQCYFMLSCIEMFHVNSVNRCWLIAHCETIPFPTKFKLGMAAWISKFSLLHKTGHATLFYFALYPLTLLIVGTRPYVLEKLCMLFFKLPRVEKSTTKWVSFSYD